MKLCIATCDSLSHILTLYAWLMDKYCPEFTDINVLGYSNFPQLPNRFDCVSLAEKQINLNQWSRNLYEYFRYVRDEYVIFTIEDLLPIRAIDYEVYYAALAEMQNDENIVRYELGTGHCWHKGFTQRKLFSSFNIYEYGYESLYRISTQTAIWRTEYLLEYLNHDWSPWEFEIEGSRLAQQDGKRVIATQFRYAWQWVQSALSSKYPDMVNVLGMQRSDVEELINLGYLKRDKLQLGIELNSPRYE